MLETSRLWRGTAARLANEYPDVALEHILIDACALALILNPSRFDTLVTGNIFGDILSDEAGALAGSLGMLPSASLGSGRGALYEPVHGTAPDIAGQDKGEPDCHDPVRGDDASKLIWANGGGGRYRPRG